MFQARRLSLAIILASFLVPTATGFAADFDFVQAGRRLFAVNCAVCHGERGDGKGEAASRLNSAPRDLTKGVYKFRSTGSSRPPTDEDLARTIAAGVPGTAMAPRPDLTETEISALVAFIKTLSDKFSKNSDLRVLPIPPPPQKTKAAISAGSKIYKNSGCIECHGARGRGDGPSSSRLSIRPADLTRRPLKGGANAKDIFRTLLTGLDGTSMPSYHQVLSEEQIWLLAFYVESLGKAATPTEDERIGREILRRLKTASSTAR